MNSHWHASRHTEQRDPLASSRLSYVREDDRLGVTITQDEPYLSVTSWCDHGQLLRQLRELAATEDPELVSWMDLADLLEWSFQVDGDRITVGGLLTDDDNYVEWYATLSYCQIRQATRRWISRQGQCTSLHRWMSNDC